MHVCLQFQQRVPMETSGPKNEAMNHGHRLEIMEQRQRQQMAERQRQDMSERQRQHQEMSDRQHQLQQEMSDRQRQQQEMSDRQRQQQQQDISDRQRQQQQQAQVSSPLVNFDNCLQLCCLFFIVIIICLLCFQCFVGVGMKPCFSAVIWCNHNVNTEKRKIESSTSPSSCERGQGK